MAVYTALTGLVDELIDPTLPKADDVTGPLYGLNAWLQGALAAEPADDPADLTLRGPVTRWLGYAFGNPRITKTEAIALLPIQPGDPSPLFQITDAISREGGSVAIGGGPLEPARVGPISRAEWRQPHYHQALVMSGGEAEGIEVVFEINDLAAEVPATFPNRVSSALSDPEDPESELVETVHTWATWGQGSRTDLAPTQIGEKWYRTSQDGNDRGSPILASQWVPASLAGLVVLASMPVVESPEV